LLNATIILSNKVEDLILKEHQVVSETMEQTFNRLRAIVSHLEFMDIEIEQVDLNQKFLTRKKISIQGTDVAGFDKSKVECFNCHKMGHFARECRAPRSQDKGRRDNYRQGSKVEKRLQRVKYCEKIKGLEFKVESRDNRIECLTNELELLKKEKEGLESKLTGFQSASKDLDSLLESQRLDKNKEGPLPIIESTSDDVQNRNPSVTETEASPSNIISKPFIKFVKATNSPTENKADKVETVRKTIVKYAELYRKTSKKSNVRGNQRNWNNLKSQQLGKNFVMKKACYNYGGVDRLSYNCGKWVDHGRSWAKNNNTHKSRSPIHKPNRPPMRPIRRNINATQTKRTSFYKPAHSYNKRQFQRTSALRSQFRGPRIPTVNRKFPIVSRKFPTGNSRFSTADQGQLPNHIDDKDYWDSGCSRHMIGNISYLSDYEPFDGGYVSFGQGGCKITMIGSLMYLTTSRPDIMFAVCAYARHQVTPKECHLHAVKRIFRYLKGHLKLRIWYPKKSPFDLVAYSDSDYDGATQDRKSTTGGCQFLGRRLISWQCKKQKIMATSTTETEYVAAASSLRYALTAKPTVYVSYIRQFCSTARIETTEEGTKILATVDGIVRTVSESSLSRNLKLRDEAGISSLPDAKLFKNLTLMGYNISLNQKFTFQKGQFSHQWKYLIHTIMQCLSPKSTGFNEFSSNIATALVCLDTNRTYNFSKIIFDGLVKNANNKVLKFLMYPRFLTMCLRMSQFRQITHTQTYVVPFHTKKLFTTLRVNRPSFSGRIVPFFDTMLIQQGEGSAPPTEPHHTPSLEAQPSLHTHIFTPTLPTVTPIPTVTPTDTPIIRQYTRRTRIAQSSVRLPVADEPASPLRDVSQGEACPTDCAFIANQDRATIAKSSTLPHDSAPRVTSPAAVEGSMQQSIPKLTVLCTSLQRPHSELTDKFQAQEVDINRLKDRVKLLKEKEGAAATNSGDDAPIKGRSMDEREAATERVSDDTEEMATVLTSMDATTILASGVVDVPTGSGSIPTGSGSIPTTSTLAEGSVPTGSEEVPTASPVFATATVVTPVTRRKGKEVMVESETPKKQKVQEQINAQVAKELEEKLAREYQRRAEQIARDAEIARIHAEEELQIMISGLDRNNETIAKYLEEYQQFSSELPMERRIELISNLVKYQDNYTKIYKFQRQQRKSWTKKQKRDYYIAVIRNNLRWKVKDFKGMTFEEMEAKFNSVWKQMEDFIPMGSKEEAERIKKKGINLEQGIKKNQKTLEEVTKEAQPPEEVPEEKVKEMMQLVPIEEVYVEALQVKHPIINWNVHSEGQRSYWKITRLGGSSASYQFFIDLLKHLDRNNLGWKVKDFRGMTFKEVEAKFNSVGKQMEDFIPIGSKEEAERIKREGLNLEQESAKKQKTSEEVLKEAMSPEEVP
nr:hypothetical protein [Tanacetum cinerariifolium]